MEFPHIRFSGAQIKLNQSINTDGARDEELQDGWTRLIIPQSEQKSEQNIEIDFRTVWQPKRYLTDTPIRSEGLLSIFPPNRPITKTPLKGTE